jgi:hypothetical protein
MSIIPIIMITDTTYLLKIFCAKQKISINTCEKQFIAT